MHMKQAFRRSSVGFEALVLAALVVPLAAACTSEVGGGGGYDPGSNATGTQGGIPGEGGAPPNQDSSSAGGAATSAGSEDTSSSSSTTGNTTPPEDLSPDFACDEAQVPDALPLRRLSYSQYRNTILDLIELSVPSEASAIQSELTPALDELPRDLRQGPDPTFARFDRLDQTVQQRLVDEEYAVALAVSEALTRTTSRLTEFVGECAEEASDDECLDAFVERFGERVQRRSLADEDIAFYRRAVGEVPYQAQDYADVAALLLTSPYALYAVEHGEEEGSGELVALSANELAARLSYQFWQTLPDAELFEAARSGALLTEEGYAAELDRIVDDPRAARGLGEFIGQWLENPLLDEFDQRLGEPVYDAFLNGFAVSGELKERMQAEVVDAALYYTEAGGSFADFFGSDRSFAKSDDLANIYGTSVWDGGEPPAFVDPEREGLLARAALLATGLSDTRPIIKGVLIRKAILCEDIPPPPAEVANEPPPAAGAGSSTREAVEAKTGSGICVSCHSQLNGLGFATENFDALGRLRSEQPLFDEEGEPAGSAAVDTNSVPQVEAEDLTESAGVSDLNRLILESDKPYACFARQYFRFTFSRVENNTKDGCALASLKDDLVSNRSLRDVFRVIALEQSFKERAFSGGAEEP
jgi:hypothetical protein